jgi:hypothetical protein
MNPRSPEFFISLYIHNLTEAARHSRSPASSMALGENAVPSGSTKENRSKTDLEPIVCRVTKWESAGDYLARRKLAKDSQRNSTMTPTS